MADLETSHATIDHTGLTGVGGAGATVSENFITGNVSVVSANTFYDGPSLSLAAGTYHLVAKVRQSTGSANTWCVAKLWDGTNIFDASEFYVETSGGGNMHSLVGTVVLGSTTTVKVSCADNSGSGTIKATPDTNNTGLTNKASHLVALKIA